MRRHYQIGQSAAFNAQRGVKVHYGGLGGDRQHALRRRQKTARPLGQHHCRDDDHLREVRRLHRATRNFVILAVPGLCEGARVGLDPRLCGRNEILRTLDNFIDQPGLERTGGLNARAFQQIGERLLQAHQVDQTNDTAAAGQQAQGHLRQTDYRAGVV